MTGSSVGRFDLTQLRSLHFGAGSLQDAVAALGREGEWRRALVVTTPSLLETQGYASLLSSLEGLERQTFSAVRTHTPAGCVQALRELVAAHRPDVAFSLGGGSAIDATKAAVLGTESEHLAIPTTLSGAEFTAYFAETDEAGEKHVRHAPDASPSHIVLDPRLALETPARLWFSTGMKSFADCIEAFCSPRGNALTERLALAGLAEMSAGLHATAADPGELDARLRCQLAPFFALPALVNAGGGLIAALRQQLGARFGIPHGVASAGVMLPVLELLETQAPGRVRALEAQLGLTDLTLREHCAALLAELGLSPNLRDALRGERLEPVLDQLMRDPFIGAQKRETVRSLLERIA